MAAAATPEATKTGAAAASRSARGTGRVGVARGRIEDADGKAREWRATAPQRGRRLTRKTGALIASVDLSGTIMRRVKHALSALFEVALSIRQCRSDHRRVIGSSRSAACGQQR